MKPVEQEVHELEGLIRVLWAEYAKLVGCFYSAQIANEEQIVSRYQTPNEWRGFEIVRAALYRCLLAKIIFDDDKRGDNPSLKRLFRQFSNEKKKCTSSLLSYLENRVVERLEGRPDGTRLSFGSQISSDDFIGLVSTLTWNGGMGQPTERTDAVAILDYSRTDGDESCARSFGSSRIGPVAARYPFHETQVRQVFGCSHKHLAAS
jgi:hypothetical protein